MPNVTDDPMCSENPPLFVALVGAFRDACERAPAYPRFLRANGESGDLTNGTSVVQTLPERFARMTWA